jgi:hypothetical protein
LAAHRRFPWAGCEGALTVVSLWLANSVNLSFTDSTFDDLLYARLANAILDGQWLGPFDQFTLARGPGFPVFLALLQLLHVPLNLGAQAVYLFGAWLLSHRVGGLLNCRAAGFCCLAALALNPLPMTAVAALVLREKLYTGVTLLAVAMLAWLLPRQPRAGAPERGWPKDAALLFAAGLSLAVFWLTREEGVWLAPALAFVLALRIGLPALARYRAGWLTAGWFALEGVRTACLPLGFGLVVLSVAGMNYAQYGVFRTNDFQSGPFGAAYGAMQRVKPAQFTRYVPVPEEARARIAAVSPAMRELMPALGGAYGESWKQAGCALSPIPECRQEIQAGWLMFAVREAVSQAGYYRSARDADKFYRRLASDINTACDSGALRCYGRRAGMLPPFRMVYLPLVWRSYWRLATLTASLSDIPADRMSLDLLAPSAPVTRQDFATAVIGPRTPPASLADSATRLVQGWVAYHGGPTPVAVIVEPTGRQVADVQISPAPEVAEALGGLDLHAMRFQIAVRCQDDACQLAVQRGAETIFSARLAGLATGNVFQDQVVEVFVEANRVLPSFRALREARTDALRVIVRRIFPAVRAAVPWLLLLALAGLAGLLLADARARRLSAGLLVPLLLLLALATRLLLLAIADATTVPAEEIRFLEPGVPLILALIASVGGAWGAKVLRR